MDDISEKISSLLNSPDGMDKIRSVAEKLLGDGKPPVADDSGISPENMASLINIAKAMSSKREDSRVKLLLALKPHLSEERGKRVDKAVKIIELMNIAPLLQNSGLL